MKYLKKTKRTLWHTEKKTKSRFCSITENWKIYVCYFYDIETTKDGRYGNKHYVNTELKLDKRS